MSKRGKRTSMANKTTKKKPAPRNDVGTATDAYVYSEPMEPTRYRIAEDGEIETPPGSKHPLAPSLAYRDEKDGIWLYKANSFDLLDAIHAKYPQGRFDCIF